MRFASVVACMACAVLWPIAEAVETAPGPNLRAWLTSNAGYRLAGESDCQCADAVKNRRDYQPYHTEGDFDGDGGSDDAYVVVSKSDATDSLILVFASRFASGRDPIVYRNRLASNLGGLGLFKGEADIKHPVLLFGAFNSEAEPIYLPIGIPPLPRADKANVPQR